MATVSMSDLKDDPKALIELAQTQTVYITKYGKVVAKLVAATDEDAKVKESHS